MVRIGKGQPGSLLVAGGAVEGGAIRVSFWEEVSTQFHFFLNKRSRQIFLSHARTRPAPQATC